MGNLNILNNRTQGGYTIVTQNITHDKNLHLRSVGLLVLLMSLPDNWRFSVKGIESIVRDGRESVESGARELEEYGYLKREKVSGEDGRFAGCKWTVTNIPFQFEPLAEKPFTGKPFTVNPQQVNKQGVTKQVDKTPKAPYEEIVGHLNDVTGSSFKHTSRATRDKINARFNDGFTKDDFISVIDFKASRWMRDKKMRSFLRPETLFGPKFEGYLQEARREEAAHEDGKPFDGLW